MMEDNRTQEEVYGYYISCALIIKSETHLGAEREC